jgi:hypothetical protein
MAKGGLLTKLGNWPWLGAQFGEAATGGVQLTQGLATGNTGMAIDGGISTVLAAGSFIPGAGPFFAVAGIAWGGMGLLATHLGYGSASEMIGDAATKTADAVGDAAKETAEAVSDGAKKVWGWLT